MSSTRSFQPIFVEENIDGGWAWIVVAASFWTRAIYDGFVYTFGVFHDELLDYFGASNAGTALVMSILVGVCAFTGPIASCLVNRYGCRRVSVAGALIATLGLLLSLAPPEVEYLYLTIGILTGFGAGLMDLTSVVIVGIHFEEKRATALGLAFSGTGIGALLLAPLMEWLIQYYCYWKGAMLIAAGLLLNCVVLSLFYSHTLPGTIRESEVAELKKIAVQTPVSSIEDANWLYKAPSKDYVSRGTETDEVQSTAALETSGSSASQEKKCCSELKKVFYEMVDLSLLKNIVFLIFLLNNFLYNLGIRAPFVYTSHRSKELGITTSRGSGAGLLLAIIGASNTLGRFLLGFLMDGSSLKTIHVYSSLLIINGVSTILTSFITRYYQMAIFCIIFGFTYGGLICLTPVMIVDLIGMHKLNNAYGLLEFIVGLALILGTPIPGMLHDVTGSYNEGFYFGGGLSITSAALLFIIPTVQRRFPPE